ncbi:MAG: aromatic ring-hydroxylating dioxygenase subunit alpha [Pseudomonadota bacterium]
MSAVMNKEMRSINELIATQRAGYSLDQRFYGDPAIYDIELEKIVFRSWYLIGHESEFTETGDFRVFKVANESAIIVRGSDGALKGFANVCRHRGSLVCLEEQGHVDKFVCPYHGWMYNVDGELSAARNMPDDFDMAEYLLKPVSVDVMHGLVFVAFTDDPPSLAACREALDEPLSMFGFKDMKVAARKHYDIPANWKLSVENYQECYHCAPAHPEYAQMHTLMLDSDKRDRVQSAMLDRLDSCGLKNLDMERTDDTSVGGEAGYTYSRTALFKKYKTGSKGGEPVAPLLGNLSDYDGGASDISIGSFSFLLAYSDHVVAYVFTPIDQYRSNCEIFWLVRSDAEEGQDYDIAELTWLWDVTTHADKKIIANNAKGVSSRYYQPGPLSGMESEERKYLNWYIGQMQR